MPSRAKLLRMASDRLDATIMEHSAVLMVSQLLEPEAYMELYREQYFKIEEATVADLNYVLEHDTENRLSLADDLAPIQAIKLKRFAWHFYPKSPERLN